MLPLASFCVWILHDSIYVGSHFCLTKHKTNSLKKKNIKPTGSSSSINSKNSFMLRYIIYTRIWAVKFWLLGENLTAKNNMIKNEGDQEILNSMIKITNMIRNEGRESLEFWILTETRVFVLFMYHSSSTCKFSILWQFLRWKLRIMSNDQTQIRGFSSSLRRNYWNTHNFLFICC